MHNHLFVSHQKHDVDREEAQRYLGNINRIKNPPYNNGVFFDRFALSTLLSLPGVTGLHYYNAKGESNLDELILVPTTLDQGHLIETCTVLHSLPEMPKDHRGNYNRVAVSHGISPIEAGLKTRDYRRQKERRQPKGGFFGADALKKVLYQRDAIGLQYLFGANDEGIRNIVVAGVADNGQIMMEQNLIELSLLCPPFCLWDNLLNSDSHIEAAIQKHYILPDPVELDRMVA